MNENIDDFEVIEEKETTNSKCPSCGAEMAYSPEEDKLKCPFCGTTKEIDAIQAKELEFNRTFNGEEEVNTWGAETFVYQCKNCGVKEVISAKDIAVKCPFCGTPNVVKIEEISGLKPNAVVPFDLTKEEACVAVKRWGKKKFYAPKDFKRSISPEGMNGVFNPAFTFDCDSDSSYRGVLGKYYYETVRTSKGETKSVRKVRYFSISGNFSYKFDDILVEASNVVSQQTINKISPFDTNNSCQYDSSFLLGFTANQYSKNSHECWGEAVEVMNRQIRRKILARYQYDVVQSLNIQTRRYNTTYKYVLLPLYVGYCAYRKKNYNFFVNGKNGKVDGKTPISGIKVFFTVLIVLIIIVAIGLLVIYLDGNGEL